MKMIRTQYVYTGKPTFR